ncbi:hypothetical protein O0L34_g3231 [Tuta absoluta]|nr:hypothetical protein O0L34_g3231 [Tuta absoluta]
MSPKLPRAKNTPPASRQSSMLPSSEDHNNVTLRKQRITCNGDNEDLTNISECRDMSLCSEIRLLREQITLMNSTLAKVVDSAQRAHEKIDVASTKLSDIDERVLNLEDFLSAPKHSESPQVEKSKRKRRKSKPLSPICFTKGQPVLILTRITTTVIMRSQNK